VLERHREVFNDALKSLVITDLIVDERKMSRRVGGMMLTADTF
jgi:hypothetical protein